MSNTVFCLAANDTQASRLVEDLKATHFEANDISVLYHDKRGTRDFAHEHHTKAPEGVTVGVTTGGVTGAAIGLLAGVGMLAIPGLGPFIAAGPILAAMSGAAAGATVGGVVGAMVGLGIPEFEAKVYEGKLHEGHVLMSVFAHDADRITAAKKVFKDGGGTDITNGTESKSPKA